MTNQLTIADTTIKTDAEGRYCLNDLHRAAGGEETFRPSYFMRSEAALSLLHELNVQNPHIPPVKGVRGAGGGTFAVKELVYAYAMSTSR